MDFFLFSAEAVALVDVDDDSSSPRTELLFDFFFFFFLLLLLSVEGIFAASTAPPRILVAISNRANDPTFLLLFVVPKRVEDDDDDDAVRQHATTTDVTTILLNIVDAEMIKVPRVGLQEFPTNTNGESSLRYLPLDTIIKPVRNTLSFTTTTSQDYAITIAYMGHFLILLPLHSAPHNLQEHLHSSTSGVTSLV